MNILFLGGGRRVELARRFLLRGCRVYAYELSRDVPVASVADVVVGKSWDNPSVHDHLKTVKELLDVRAVLPLDDKAAATVGWPWSYRCYDKQEFSAYCRRHCPDLYPTPEIGKPYVIKPRFGNGSKGIHYEYAFPRNTPYESMTHVYQKQLTGKEFSVDAYFNKAGALVGASPRERLRVAGGEVVESVTVDRPDLVKFAKSVGGAVGAVGPTCIQFIEDEDGTPFVIEANHRFGGGATLSIEAGLDMVDYVIREARGETVGAGTGRAEPGLRMVRSMKDHFFRS
jgi:hypothetical protein